MNNEIFDEYGRVVVTKPLVDNINHPSHYTGTYECIDAMIQCFGEEAVKEFCLCNAFKYLWRCKQKHDDPAEDIDKAMWYLNKYKELNGEAL